MIEVIPQSSGIKTVSFHSYSNGKLVDSISINIKVISKQPFRLELPDPVGARPIPQPDVCIRVYQTPDRTNEKIRLEYVVFSPHYALRLPGIPAGSVNVKKTEIIRLITRLEHSLQNKDTNITSETLNVIGFSLYNLLFPAQLKNIYLDIYDKINNILF